MNKGLIFAGGTLLGAITGFFIGYIKAGKDFKQGVDEIHSNDIPEKYIRQHIDEGNDESEETNELRDRKELDKIKKKLTDNWTQTTNYAAAYNPSKENKNSEDDKSDIQDEETLGGMDEETTNFLKEREGREPKIISETAASGLPAGIDHQCLFYWQYDDTLTTEDDEEIEDVERFLGDALTKYGFSENEEKTIYVINYELGTVYEIEKIERAFHAEN